MQKHILLLAISLCILIILGAVFLQREKNMTKQQGGYAEPIQYTEDEMVFGEEAVFIAKAKSSAELTKGLSDQENIAHNQGLLFVFPQVSEHGIWMRDMNFSIDIIWLDEDLRVVDIKERASPESFRNISNAEVFTPKTKAKYVLEVAAGFVERTGVAINDIATLHVDNTAPQE